MILNDYAVIRWPFFIAVVLLGIFVIFVCLAIIQSSYGKQLRRHVMEEQNRKIYHFKFDFKNKEVYFFKHLNAQSSIKEPLKSFFSRIRDPRHLTLFKAWLKNVKNGNDDVLANEIDILIDKNTYLSIYFNVTSIDKENEIIHCDGYEVLKEHLQENGAFSNDIIIDNQGISIDTAFLRQKGNQGYMLYIRFFPIKKTVTSAETEVIRKELRKVCIAFVNESENRYKINVNTDALSFPMIDYSSDMIDSYQEHLLILERRLGARLEAHKLSKSFDYCIAAGSCSEYTNPNELLHELKAQTYFSDSRTNHLEWFSRRIEDSIERTIDNRNEIDTIINYNFKDRKVASLFTPLFNMDESSFFGFYTRTVPFYTTFRTLNEIFEAAEKFDNLQEVSKSLLKRIIIKYYNEFIRANIVRGQKINRSHLLIDLYPAEIPFFIEMISDIRYFKASNPIIMIDDSCLNRLASNDANNAFNFLQRLRNMNVELCYRIKSRDIPWPSELLEKFDYFLIDNRVYVDDKVNESISLKTIINKLEIYDKPFIAVEVSNRNEYKVLFDKGVKICGGEYLGAEGIDLSIPNLIRITKLKDRK